MILILIESLILRKTLEFYFIHQIHTQHKKDNDTWYFSLIKVKDTKETLVTQINAGRSKQESP